MLAVHLNHGKVCNTHTHTIHEYYIQNSQICSLCIWIMKKYVTRTYTHTHTILEYYIQNSWTCSLCIWIIKMYVYIHIYIYTHIHTHAHIMHTFVHILPGLRTYTHTCIHSYVCTQTPCKSSGQFAKLGSHVHVCTYKHAAGIHAHANTMFKTRLHGQTFKIGHVRGSIFVYKIYTCIHSYIYTHTHHAKKQATWSNAQNWTRAWLDWISFVEDTNSRYSPHARKPPDECPNGKVWLWAMLGDIWPLERTCQNSDRHIQWWFQAVTDCHVKQGIIHATDMSPDCVCFNSCMRIVPFW